MRIDQSFFDWAQTFNNLKKSLLEVVASFKRLAITSFKKFWGGQDEVKRNKSSFEDLGIHEIWYDGDVT